jgi:hypothetical protein
MLYWVAIAWVVIWSLASLLGGFNIFSQPGQTERAIVQIAIGLLGTASIAALFFNRSLGTKLAVIFLVCLVIAGAQVFTNLVVPALSVLAIVCLGWPKQERLQPPQSN